MQYHNAHHNPEYPDFDKHVLYFGENLYCLGCFISNLFISLLPVYLLILYPVLGGVSEEIDAVIVTFTAVFTLSSFLTPYFPRIEEVFKGIRGLVLAVTLLVAFWSSPGIEVNTFSLIVASLLLALPQYLLHLYKLKSNNEFKHKRLKAGIRLLFYISLFLPTLLWYSSFLTGLLINVLLLGVFLLFWLPSKNHFENNSMNNSLTSPGIEVPRLKNLSCVGPLNACTKGGGKGGCCGCNLQPCVAFIGVAIILTIVFLFVTIGINPGRP